MSENIRFSLRLKYMVSIISTLFKSLLFSQGTAKSIFHRTVFWKSNITAKEKELDRRSIWIGFIFAEVFDFGPLGRGVHSELVSVS